MSNILVAEGFEDLTSVASLNRRVESVFNFNFADPLNIVNGYLNDGLSNSDLDIERRVQFNEQELTSKYYVGFRANFQTDTFISSGNSAIEPVRIFGINLNTFIALSLFTLKVGNQLTVIIQDSENAEVINETITYTQGWVHFSLEMSVGPNSNVELVLDGTSVYNAIGDFLPNQSFVNSSSIYLPKSTSGTVIFDDCIIANSKVTSDLAVVPVPFNSEELQDDDSNTSISLDLNTVVEFQASLPKVRGDYKGIVCYIFLRNSEGTEYALAIAIRDVTVIREIFTNTDLSFFSFYVDLDESRNFFTTNNIRINTGV